MRLNFFKRAGAVLFCFFTIVPLMRAGIVSISLKGGFLLPLANSFAGPPVDSLNMVLDDMDYLFGQSEILHVRTNQLNRIDSLSGWGGEFEIQLKKRISLALGIDYCRSESGGDFLAQSTLPDAPYQYQRNLKFRMTVIPVLATFRYHFYLGNLDTYSGVGLGFHRVQMEGISAYRDILEEGEDLFWKAGGSGLIPHFQGGIFCRLLKGLAFGFSLDFAFGNIRKFVINESEDQALIGKPLEFVSPAKYLPQDLNSSAGTASMFVQSQLGLRASLVLKYTF